MVNPVTPTRNQIAKMAQEDPDLIKALEQLFTVSGTTTPADIAALTILIENAAYDAGVAANKSESYQANSATFDYVDVRKNAPHSEKEGRLCWNDQDATINIGMDYGVSQQVGMETYARVQNSTGVTIPNGTVVGFAGAGSTEQLLVTKYIADGTQSTLNILGVMTHELPDSGQVGYCTTWGHVRELDTRGTNEGEVWAVGDLLYASPTIAGSFTKFKPTSPNNVVPIAVVLKVDQTEGEIFVRPTIEQQQYYGQIVRTTDYTAALPNTAYAVPFTTEEISQGVSIGTPASRIVVDVSGLYDFAVVVQITSGSASTKNAWFWWRVNGVDISQSANISSISNNGFYLTISKSDFFTLNAGDYVELMFSVDDVNLTLDATAATAFAPAAPSVLLTVTQTQQ